MNLTEHFTLERLCFSDTAVRLGIDNTPPPHIAERMRTVLAPNMERVRSILGDVPVLESSGYRCEALERVICAKDFVAWCARRGVPADDVAWSIYFAGKKHPQGYCLDFTAPKFGTPLDIVRKVDASGLPYDQFIMEGTWVHACFAPSMRRETLTAHFVNGVATYTNGA